MARQVGPLGLVCHTDVNREMLEHGRRRLVDPGIVTNVSSCRRTPSDCRFANHSFHCVSIGFGLRNCTNKPAALKAMVTVLRPGGGCSCSNSPNRSVARAPLRRSTPSGYCPCSASSWPATRPATATWPNRSACTRTGGAPRAHGGEAGLEDCPYHNLSGGIVALHVATDLLRLSRESLLPRYFRPSSSDQPRPRSVLDGAGAGRALEGRALRLSVDGTPLDLRLPVTEPRVTAPRDGTATDPGAGSPLAWPIATRRPAGAGIRDGDVQMTGDTDIAKRFRELLRIATPDLEEELSRLVGDPIARQVGNATRAFAEWGAAAGTTVERSVTEYLQEESRLLPKRADIEAFSRQVDALVNDVARAEARIERLKEPL